MPDRHHMTMGGALPAVALLLLLAQPYAHARSLRATAGIALPDYTVYHHKDDLLNKVADIVKAHPDTMKMVVRSAGDTAYNISMQVVDVDLGGATHKDDSKVRMLVDFGEHAREYISSELGLAFMQTLADPAAIRALVGGGERGDKLIAQLNKVTFKILPMENERGRDLVESGKLCERKNGRGVDPNRNWEVDWGKKEKDYDPQEEYPGLNPFSEPETQIVHDLAKTFKPHVWLNIHSGMEAMFTPWDHIGEVAEGAKDALKILNAIKDSVFTDKCVVGSGGKSVGYLAHGTATDYMFERLHVPMAYTWEIYGDMEASFNDCFRMFNPIGKENMQKIVTMWLKAIFRLVELLPTHPDIVKENIFDSGLSKAVPGAATPQADVTSHTNGKPSPVTDAGNGQRDVPEAIVVHTPLQSLQQNSVWATLAFGIGAVALVGFGMYRYASKKDVGRKSPFEV